MPLQMILLAMLAMATRDIIVTSEGLAYVKPPLHSATAILGVLIGSYLLLVMVVAVASRQVIRRLHSSNASATDITHDTHRLIDYARWAAVLLLGVHLWYLGWGYLVFFTWGQLDHEMAAEFLFILPVIITFLCFWSCTYYIDRAVRDRALPFNLQLGRPAHPMPGLLSYLFMQSRHNFYILVIIVFKGVIDRLTIDNQWSLNHPATANVLLGLVMITLFAITPWIIINMWKTVSLPDPPASRLYAVAKKYHIRFTRILLWHTHNMMPNAMILGPVPLVRYFLMTDALLESLTDRQIEAVFAHEIGHGHHRHMWWYLAFFVGAVGVTAGAGLAGLVIPYLRSDVANTIMSFGLLAILMKWGFSFVSHRCENQADWFAAKHMAESLAQEPEMLADASTVQAYTAGAVASPTNVVAAPTAQTGENLLKGAEIFGSSLRNLVDLSHRSLNKPDWLHPSVNQRVELVNRLAASPDAVKQFDRMQRNLRWVIVSFVALGICLMILANALLPASAPPATQPEIHTSPHAVDL